MQFPIALSVRIGGIPTGKLLKSFGFLPTFLQLSPPRCESWVKLKDLQLHSREITLSDSKTSPQKPEIPSTSSRRDFLKKTSTVAATATAITAATPSLTLARSANVAGVNTVKIGLVGCGGRGTGAAIQAMNTQSGNVQLAAMADVFEDRSNLARKQFEKEHPDKVLAKDSDVHVGLDGYKKVIESDVDLVILATPPGFRPLHFATAIEAGKHVFMEKPVGVDAPGIRKVLKYGKIASEKNLLVQVGLQRRHERAYRETIEQLKGGLIGDLLYSRVYWNSRGVWERPRKEGQSELDYQMRNWYYFNWLCGDHIVEQHIHNLDVINWLMEDYPVTAAGMGGRLVRDGIDNGEIYDHHAVEYTYANGHKMFSQCRHMPDCFNPVSEHVVGTKGSADIADGRIFSPEPRVRLQQFSVVWRLTRAKNSSGMTRSIPMFPWLEIWPTCWILTTARPPLSQMKTAGTRSTSRGIMRA